MRGGCLVLGDEGCKDYYHDPLKWGASNKYHAAIRCAQLIFLLEGGTRDYLHDPLRWGLQINTMQPFAALICIFYFKMLRQVNLSHPFEIKNAACGRLHWIFLAEREGFEPSIPFRGIHTFQACSFNHSDISPAERMAKVRLPGLILKINRINDGSGYCI